MLVLYGACQHLGVQSLLVQQLQGRVWMKRTEFCHLSASEESLAHTFPLCC